MLGTEFTVNTTGEMEELGYDKIKAIYNSFGSIDDLSAQCATQNVCLIVANSAVIAQYCQFFDRKSREVMLDLKGSINTIEQDNLSCRMQFGDETAKAAHTFLCESWGLKQTKEKIVGWFKSKRVFLTNGFSPNKL
ncbi:hypothetical protein, partial [uncultured Shewanella sp.]|uniref:hypothetical protein n=1 Tax=uncultured Shewanella sp. TaxID=173975 RepID=UPI0026126EC8